MRPTSEVHQALRYETSVQVSIGPAHPVKTVYLNPLLSIMLTILSKLVKNGMQNKSIIQLLMDIEQDRMVPTLHMLSPVRQAKIH